MRHRRVTTWGAAVVAAASIAIGGSAGAKLSEPGATVAAFDRSATLRSVVDGSTTVVTSVPGGETVVTIDEPLQLRAVEPGGRRIALATPLPAGADAYRPGGRASTRLVVADLDTGATRSYDVPRNVEPEAFGVGIGGRDRLFVVDHRPAEEPSSYRVGAINLASGEFEGLIGPNKRPLDIDMTGVARKQVLSASGDQLYTLYLEHEHGGGTSGERTAGAHGSPVGQGVAFVHVLDLAGVWAYCVDLPGIGHGPASASSIRLSADGTQLVVTDRHAGQRLVIPTVDLQIEQLASGPPTVTRRGSAQ